jgi:NAD-dependent deacetylase
MSWLRVWEKPLPISLRFITICLHSLFMSGVADAVELIRNSTYVTVLTGAGISAESGIPTFRGRDGLWNKYKPEELATPYAFRRNPSLVWEWYAWRMKLVFSKKPNPAHYALAEMEDEGIVKYIITQNVDDLHERAGSKNVLHLHGTLRNVKCSNSECGYLVSLTDDLDLLKSIPESLPECPECNSLLRPAVVWFGESLDPEVLSKAFHEAEKSDLMLVVGTSAVVQPAASIPLVVKREGRVGGSIIEINLDATPLTHEAAVSIRDSAGSALQRILEELNR